MHCRQPIVEIKSKVVSIITYLVVSIITYLVVSEQGYGIVSCVGSFQKHKSISNMGNVVADIIICLLLLFSVGVIYGTSEIFKSFVNNGYPILTTSSYSWIVLLCLNVLGYATVLLPGYLIYKYVRYTKYIQRGGKSCIPSLVHSCFVGHCETGLLDSVPYTPTSSTHGQRTFAQDAFLLMYCFCGLQISYLTWGYLQEKIMTQEYQDAAGNTGRFQDSQFLVFVNRVLAFVMSGTYLLIKRQPQHKAPLYKYAFCSLSNIMSSWCQYEALKYVSFPTQVLAKASKIIPVMLMGKLISRTSYEYYEYVTAVLISIGITLFTLDGLDNKNDGATTISGVILLGGYLLLDSFTSIWQDSIFSEYGSTTIQMMCAVNMFSCLFTVMSLFQQSSFPLIFSFMTQYPRFVIDCLLISICSASGQLYIFYTILKFGPVTFVIIMTIRQGLAILLSCLIYRHQVTIVGILGILLVFGSVFLRIYCKNRLRAIKRRRAAATSVKDQAGVQTRKITLVKIYRLVTLRKIFYYCIIRSLSTHYFGRGLQSYRNYLTLFYHYSTLQQTVCMVKFLQYRIVFCATFLPNCVRIIHSVNLYRDVSIYNAA